MAVAWSSIRAPAATRSTRRSRAGSASSSRSRRSSTGPSRSSSSPRTTPASTSGWRGCRATASSSSLAELEPLAETRILVAGIGNLFLGDDGFGCEVARRLADAELPAGTKVVDFGIRGLDLAYALHEGYDAAILIDASPRGEPAGTLSVIEPDPDDDEVVLDTHGMDPVRVLQLSRELGGALPRTLVVACEPARIVDPDEEDLLAELSPAVRSSLDGAVALVLELLSDLTSPLPKGGPAR